MLIIQKKNIIYIVVLKILNNRLSKTIVIVSFKYILLIYFDALNLNYNQKTSKNSEKH